MGGEHDSTGEQRRRPRVSVLAGLTVVGALAVWLSSPLTSTAAAASIAGAVAAPVHEPCGWEAPVDAQVVDPFRPPAHPYGGGGNRGLEFDTVGGEQVRAVDDGRVTFVGPVGGERWLVITHDGGLRSTYGPLASTAVVRGQTVGTGAELGTAEPGLHLTARSANRYLDPAPLLDGTCGRARLVTARRAGSPGGIGPVRRVIVGVGQIH